MKRAGKSSKPQPKDNHKISSFFSVINKNVATTSADIVVKNEPLQENEHLEKKIKLSNASPKKVLKEIQTTPEKKVTKSTPRSISPSKKSTPKKLFDRSPKHLESFNVQAIDDFVKITPSKSNKKVVCSTRVFDITPEKMQSSLLRYLSPSPSPKSQQAKAQNENTPSKNEKSTLKKVTPMKVKTKLNFGAEIIEIPDEFDDDFDNQIAGLIEEVYKLDLSESQHCKVLEVNKFPNRLAIVLECTATRERAKCSLEGFWHNMQIKVGDQLHVSAREGSSSWQVTNDSGLVIYEPDLLLPTTAVVGSLFCKRKSVIGHHYKGFDGANHFMVVGSLVHQLLQDCIVRKFYSDSSIIEHLETLMKQPETIQRLYESSLKSDEIRAELIQFVPRICDFMETYMKRNQSNKASWGWNGTITGISDIEENLWCPQLGVKGKVDISIESGDLVMPLELKTGRASMSLEHRAQVILYVLMMKKFGHSVTSGLLLYLKENVLKQVDLSSREARDILILRNELAFYLNNTKINQGNVEELFKKSVSTGFLPEPINHHSACKNCEYATICCAYLKAENFDLTNNPILKTVEDQTFTHLTKSHMDYFLHWSMLLMLESAGTHDANEIFTVPPDEREKQGKCISSVQVIEVEYTNGMFMTTFERQKENAASFLDFEISEGSYIVVSTERRPAVATGFVTDKDEKSITISLDRDLRKKYASQTFHLHTYDSSVVYTFNMSSLALLLDDTERAHRLRKIIIDKEIPTFRAKLPKIIVEVGASILKRLNVVQQRAVLRALGANDYLLIKGMPGTGKTSMIVALIELLVAMKKSVLITSHTHSAVDNVCVRLQNYGVEVLRIGATKKVHPDLKHRCATELIRHCTTPEELEEIYNGSQVVAVTCLGSGHPLMSKKVFDICIVDESTQVPQPSVLRAIFAAKKFVLIGDSDQLPPVVKNLEALKRGMSESLFERLQNPESTASLNLNYRMNSVITDLANKLTYNGELQVANDTVANSHITLPHMKVLSSIFKDHQWILDALDESISSSVKFINTGPVWKLKLCGTQDASDLIKKLFSVEDGATLTCCNPYESITIAVLVHALLKAGSPASNIGIVSPFRAQVTQLKSILQSTGVEISTVDQFQGRDKSIMMLSCTKSYDILKKSSDELTFEILEDTRRLNVAITRAKHKLIVVGDESCLGKYKPFVKLLNSIDKNQFINLPNDVDYFCDLASLIEDL